MNRKIFNSIYPQNPPEVNEEPKNPDDFLEEMISEHNFERSYENDTSFDSIERFELSELIKWEKR